MKYLIYTLALIVLLGLNIVVFNNLDIQGQIPNLLLLISICFAIDNEGFDFIFIAFVSGLFLDFFSTSFFGAYTSALLCVSLLIYFFINNFVEITIRLRSLAISLFFSLILYNLVIWFFGFVVFKLNLVQNHTAFKTYASVFYISFLYNLVLIFPVYFGASNLRKFVENLNIRRRGIVR